MPAAWIGVGLEAYNTFNGGGSAGHTGGSGPNMYVPTGLGNADAGWQYDQAMNQGQLGYMGGGYVPFMGYQPPGYGYGPQGMSQGMDPYSGWSMAGNGSMQQHIPSATGGGMTASPAAHQGAYMGGDSYIGGQPGKTATGPYGGGIAASQQGQQGQQGGGMGYPMSMGQGGLSALVDPAIYQSYAMSQGINYNPYLQSQNAAGQQYGALGQMAGNLGQQMMGYGNQSFAQERALQDMGNQFYGQQQGLGNQAAGLAGGLQQAGQSIYQAGFDPQNALHDKLQQQTLDRANATNSMYGLGASGVGAGIANDATTNFNLDWQNQQLGRELQGVQGMMGANQAAGGLLGQAGQLYAGGAQGLNDFNRTAGNYAQLGGQQLGTGFGYYGQMPGYTQQAGQIPLNAQQYVAGMPQQNAQGYIQGMASAMSPYQQMQNQAIPYMNYGSGAGATAYQNTIMGNQFQANQLAGSMRGLGNSVGALNTPGSDGFTPWQNMMSYFGSGPTGWGYGQGSSDAAWAGINSYDSGAYGGGYGGP